GIQPPNGQGSDVSPLWQRSHLPDRTTLAELKSEFDGRVCKMAQLGEWKLGYSLLDGKQELFRLADEKNDRSSEEPPMAGTMSKAIRDWVKEEDFWPLYAHGWGKFSGWLEPVRHDHGH